jgi:hypothetical protein
LQDRLVKELRLAGAATLADGNALLPAFMADYNARFAQGFQTLLAGMSAGDLRIGARFTLDRAQTLHSALRDAARTIDRMPSTFMTYPMGGRILAVERGRLRVPPSIVELDTDYLTAFGWMRVPGHLWRAMRAPRVLHGLL